MDESIDLSDYEHVGDIEVTDSATVTMEPLLVRQDTYEKSRAPQPEEDFRDSDDLVMVNSSGNVFAYKKEKAESRVSKSEQAVFDARVHWPRNGDGMEVVGRLSVGCTGSQYARRYGRVRGVDGWILYVLTAAHCVFGTKNGANTILQGWLYTPKLDATRTPTAPLGVYKMDSVWTYRYYLDTCITGSQRNSDRCLARDIAVAGVFFPVAPMNAIPSLPMVAQYLVKTDSQLRSSSSFNIGYPGCGTSKSPPGCIANVPFGDPYPCIPDSFSMKANGWNRLVRSGGCAQSPGHSGGPYLTYHGNTGDYSVSQNAVWGVAVASGTESIERSYARRITPDFLTYMRDISVGWPNYWLPE